MSAQNGSPALLVIRALVHRLGDVVNHARGRVIAACREHARPAGAQVAEGAEVIRERRACLRRVRRKHATLDRAMTPAVRLRHRKTKGNGSRMACLAMVFKLCQSAEEG